MSQHLPPMALPGAAAFLMDAAGQTIAQQVFARRQSADVNVLKALFPAAFAVPTGPTFRAHANTGTSITAANTPQKINLQVEDWDPSNAFSSSRFQPAVAGYYQINGAVETGATTGYLIAIISKNGASQALGGYVFIAAGTAGAIGNVSDIVFLNGSTDYVELWAQSGAIQTTSGTAATNYLSGCWLHS